MAERLGVKRGLLLPLLQKKGLPDPTKKKEKKKPFAERLPHEEKNN